MPGCLRLHTRNFRRHQERLAPGLRDGWHGCNAGSAVAPILSIWVLGDGKPGHENQALGLADAMARLRGCVVRQLSVAGKYGLLARLRAALRAAAALPKPDLLIGAGHATHPALLWLARQHRVPSVVLMRPSLPLSWFDLCIAPAHDFDRAPAAANVVTSMGALNRVVANRSTPRGGGLLLVGGPSDTHDWDEHGLLDSLLRICGDGTGGPWQLTDSGETSRDWLPGRLAAAADVWVTEDSVSMVYEALSSGARVGVLPVPRHKHDTRVLRGLARLVDAGWVTSYERWCQTGVLAAPPHALQEATRCAEVVLAKFFPSIPAS